MIKTKGFVKGCNYEWTNRCRSVDILITVDLAKGPRIDVDKFLDASATDPKGFDVFLDVPETTEWKERALEAEKELAKMKQAVRELAGLSGCTGAK
jgi:hypothetical protein